MFFFVRFQKLKPKIEVVVVDPFSIYSSENEERDSDSDIDSEIDLQQPELHDFHKSGDLTCVPPSSQESVQLVESSGSFYPAEPVDTVQHIELIDGLFDNVTFNTEEEHILLREMKSFEEDNQNFDLAAYITDQSVSPIDSPELTSPNENNKTHPLHPMVQQPIKADDSKIIADNSRRKKLKREYLGDGSDSEDDCKKLKKRKTEDDPLWILAEKLKATANKNQKVQPSNKDIYVVPKINGIRHRTGRGKDIATLAKYYKRSTFVENSNCDNAVNKPVKRNQKSLKEKSPKKKTIENVNKVKEQIHKKIENNSSAQKSESVIIKSKVKEINNKAADLSDFANAIMASMEAPKINANLSKRNKFTSQKIQFQEHSETFRQYLSDKASKPKILKENNHRVPVASIVNSVPKARNIDSRKLLSRVTPEQSRQMGAENCAMIEKKEELTTGTCEISIYESLQWKSVPQSAASDQNIDSNVKRKITVEEYFKRKAIVQSA